MQAPNRFDYVAYDDQAQAEQKAFKEKFKDLEDMVAKLPPSRAASLVFTKLEEAYMWIGKSIRDSQIARNSQTKLQEERGNQ